MVGDAGAVVDMMQARHQVKVARHTQRPANQVNQLVIGGVDVLLTMITSAFAR